MSSEYGSHTALGVAASHAQLGAVGELLGGARAGCDVDGVDGSGQTALHAAAAHGPLIKTLSNKRPLSGLCAPPSVTPRACLFLFISRARPSGHVEICEALLDFGAHIDAIDGEREGGAGVPDVTELARLSRLATIMLPFFPSSFDARGFPPLLSPLVSARVDPASPGRQEPQAPSHHRTSIVLRSPIAVESF